MLSKFQRKMNFYVHISNMYRDYVLLCWIKVVSETRTPAIMKLNYDNFSLFLKKKIIFLCCFKREN